jgi:Ca2+-binding EF-hand superfamily protein
MRTEKKLPEKMGIHKSKLNKVAMNKLVEETNFTKQEIRHWHDGFLHDCPTGKLTKYEFAKIYQSFFPKGDPTAFAAFVFNVFDENNDGSIEFSEFITALSLTSRGHFEEQLECKLIPCL